jgi:hypothetical protein
MLLQDLLFHFTNGLSEKVKYEVMSNDPKTMDSALAFATQFEHLHSRNPSDETQCLFVLAITMLILNGFLSIMLTVMFAVHTLPIFMYLKALVLIVTKKVTLSMIVIVGKINPITIQKVPLTKPLHVISSCSINVHLLLEVINVHTR